MLTFNDLPASAIRGSYSLAAPTLSNAKAMADLFGNILQNEHSDGAITITHTAPVSGMPGSCRLLLANPLVSETTSLPKPYTLIEMAQEILGDFASIARFPLNR